MIKRQFTDEFLLRAFRDGVIDLAVEWDQIDTVFDERGRGLTVPNTQRVYRINGIEFGHLAAEICALIAERQAEGEDAEQAFAHHCQVRGIKLGGQFAGEIKPGYLAGYAAGNRDKEKGNG